MQHDHSGEPVAVVLGTGTWRDLLPRLPRPVLALGPRHVYRVLLEGSGFSLRLDGRTERAVGFFTTRFVAAANVREAEATARSAVLREWTRRGYERRAGSAPALDIDDLEVIHSRFVLRSGAGFTFFSSAE